MKHEIELVVLSDDWFGLPFSCKHLLKNFLPDTHIIWVETIGLRSPGLSLYDLRRSLTKISGWLRKKDEDTREIPGNLRIVNPVQIPYTKYSIIRKLNAWNIKRAVGAPKKNVKRVVVTTWPFVDDIIGFLDEDLSIYYRVDDFSEFPGVNKTLIIRLEDRLVKKVSFVVATAKKLMEVDKDPSLIRLLPHGVDFQHFYSSTERKEHNSLLGQYKRPRIGFFGLLNSWLDLDFIQHLADLNPEWSLVVVGPSQLPDRELPSAANIHYLGSAPYEKLPDLAAQFDIGLIPFKINELTLAVNPLKLMEYFALGLPVVSTPLPEVLKYGDAVEIVRDAREATDKIKALLDEDGSDKAVARQELAKSNSWEAKASELKKWIVSSLEGIQ